MAVKLPPPPTATGQFDANVWQDWMRQIQNLLTSSGAISWKQIDFTGSNLTDIVVRNHNDLQNLQGGSFGQEYHITQDQHDNVVGKLSWDSADGTLDIAMGYDSVVQPIGLAQYIRIYNTTGATLQKGKVIGLAGQALGEALGKLYIADGTMPNGYCFGLAAMDIANNSYGLVSIYGHTHNLDTSMFSAGDILYASPTVPGGLTTVRPTPPNRTIPIGIVLTVSPTVGVILTKPVINVSGFSGSFLDTTTQTAAAANTPQAITLNTTMSSTGISIGSPTSRIVTSFGGLYNFEFSLQVTSSSSSSQTVTLWPRINGVDVANSATDITINSNTSIIVPAWNFDLSMQPNDYFELIWSTTSTNVTLTAKPAQTTPFTRPAIPSAIVTVVSVYQ